MDEQKDVVKTTTTVEKEGSKIGWGVLGFFVPIVGLILFLLWKKNKNKSAKAAGIGAIIGAGVTVLATASLCIGIFGLFPIAKYGSEDIVIKKEENDSVNDFSISDSAYFADWSDNYAVAKLKNYNILDESGKKLFQIQEANAYTSSNKFSIITNSGEELSFDEDYPRLSTDEYNFYYKDNVVIFNVGNKNTGYYFYDLSNSKLYTGFVDDEKGNEGLNVTDIEISYYNNEMKSITFDAGLYTGLGENTSKKSVHNKVLNGEYKSLDELKKALKNLKLDDFIVEKVIVFEKNSNSFSDKPTITKKTIIDLYKEKYDTTSDSKERKNDCVGKFTHGSSSNEYILAADYDCENITYKLNDDFTIKTVKNDDGNTDIYINDKNKSNSIFFYQNQLKVGISGKTLITQGMHQTTTNGGISVIAIGTNGNEYNFQANPEGRGRDINLFSVDGMLDEDFTIDRDGLLTITETRSTDDSIRINDNYIFVGNLCDSSYEELASKYGISEDYAYKANYTFKVKDNGLFDFNYSDVKTTETLHEYYNSRCNR